MIESIGKLENTTLTLEQKELISKMTLLYGNLLDIYIHTEDGGENMLIKTKQLAEQIDDLVMRELFKNLGNLLDACNNEQGGDERVLRKAINLSRED